MSDAWPMRRQTYGYFPSRKASPPTGWYQIILLTNKQNIISNVWFLSHFYDKVTDSDWCAAQSALDIMNILEGSSVLKFSDSTFSASELSFIMLHVATNHTD